MAKPSMSRELMSDRSAFLALIFILFIIQTFIFIYVNVQMVLVLEIAVSSKIIPF
jgi:hypothetical protein